MNSRFEKRYKFLLCLLLGITLLPFSLDVSGIPNVQIRELAVPLFFFYFLMHYLYVGGKVDGKKGKRTAVDVLVIIFFFVIAMNYIRNPLLPTHLTDSDTGGFKTYYRFALCFITYILVVFWTQRIEGGVYSALRFLLYFVLAVCLFGIATKFFGITLPGLDTHIWTGNKGATGVRLPFIEFFGQIGFVLGLAGVCSRKYRWVWIGFFVFCIFLGGGRIGAATSVGGICVYFFVEKKMKLLIVSVMSVAVLFSSLSWIQSAVSDPTLTRILSVGSLEESSVGRYYVYKEGLKAFMDSPIIGTGYGVDIDVGLIVVRGKFVEADFVRKQLAMGGHGTHIAILKNLGLVGYVPFLLLWLFPALILFKYLRVHGDSVPDEAKRASSFLIVVIAIYMVRMVVEGNGSEYIKYIFLGLASAQIAQIRAFFKQKRAMDIAAARKLQKGAV